MQQLVDFFPLIAFFASLKLGGIYVATGVFMAACLLQIAWHWWRTRTVKTLHWVTAVLVLIFGTATLLFKDARFIQWKPTVLMWLFAVAFAASHFIGAKPLTQRFLESVLGERVAPRPSAFWHRLNLLWIAFFVALGALNLYVAWKFSIDAWGTYKVFGQTLLSMLFMLPQVMWLMPKEPTAASDNASRDGRPGGK